MAFERVIVLAPERRAEDALHLFLYRVNARPGLFPRRRLGANTKVHAVGSRIGPHPDARRIIEVLRHLIDSALTDADGLQGPSDEHLAIAAPFQLRARLLSPHPLHLRWDARHTDNHAAIALDPPARRCAPRIVQRAGARDEPRLLDVRFRHRIATACEEAAQLCFQLRHHRGRLFQQGGYAFAGHIVFSGAESARDDYEVAAFPCPPEGLYDAAQVVAHDALVVEVDAQLRELLRNVGAVRIDDFAEQNLCANRDYFRFHGSEDREAAGCWLSGGTRPFCRVCIMA